MSNRYLDAKNGDVVLDDSAYPHGDIKVIEKEVLRGNGGSTAYYSLPKGATELKDLIKFKRMEHGIGEAFCALYRLNDTGEYLRNLKKAMYYIEEEIKWYEERVLHE